MPLSQSVLLDINPPNLAAQWMMGNLATLLADLGDKWPGCAQDLTDEVGMGLRMAESLYNLRTAAVWAQTLGLPRVGVNDNFFELGGDSILSVQIVARARQAGLLFTMRQVFEHQTVAGLARHVLATDTTDTR